MPTAGPAFFAGLGQEDHVAVERDVQPLQQQHRHQRRGQVVLVVDGAAAVDVAAFARRAQRRVGPFRFIGGDGIAVADDQERPLPAVALQPRHQVGTVGIRSDDLRGNPFLLEHAFDVLGDDVLVAGRVARVDAQHRLVMPHRLVLELDPVGLCRRLSEDRDRGSGCKNDGDPAERHRPSWGIGGILTQISDKSPRAELAEVR